MKKIAVLAAAVAAVAVAVPAHAATKDSVTPVWNGSSLSFVWSAPKGVELDVDCRNVYAPGQGGTPRWDAVWNGTTSPTSQITVGALTGGPGWSGEQSISNFDNTLAASCQVALYAGNHRVDVVTYFSYTP